MTQHNLIKYLAVYKTYLKIMKLLNIFYLYEVKKIIVYYMSVGI